MTYSDVVITTIVLSDIQENCFVVSKHGSDECVVIDPGMEPEKIVDFLREASLTPVAILITHGHWDHIAGIERLKDEWKDAIVCVGENDRYKLTDALGNLSIFHGLSLSTIDADRSLKDGETFDFAGLSFKTIEVPGHSRGHVAYLLETDERSIVFCGDIIFAGSVGRTDFPDGSRRDLLANIREKLLSLPDDAVLFPGHGPETALGIEKRDNPYLQF